MIIKKIPQCKPMLIYYYDRRNVKTMKRLLLLLVKKRSYTLLAVLEDGMFFCPLGQTSLTSRTVNMMICTVSLTVLCKNPMLYHQKCLPSVLYCLSSSKNHWRATFLGLITGMRTLTHHNGSINHSKLCMCLRLSGVLHTTRLAAVASKSIQLPYTPAGGAIATAADLNSSPAAAGTGMLLLTLGNKFATFNVEPDIELCHRCYLAWPVLCNMCSMHHLHRIPQMHCHAKMLTTDLTWKWYGTDVPGGTRS